MELIPANHTQGTTLSAYVPGGDYPATAYTGTCYFHDGQTKVTATVTADGDDYAVTLTSTQTASMRPGVWSWQAFASATGVRYEIGRGQIIIEQDLSVNQTPPHDPRSTPRRLYEQLSEMLARPEFVKTLAPDQIAELERVRKQAQWDIKREDDAAKLKAGGYPSRKIFTRFA